MVIKRINNLIGKQIFVMVQRIGIESVAFYIPIFSTTCFYSSAALAVLIYIRPPHRLTLSDSGMILKNASVTSSGGKKNLNLCEHIFSCIYYRHDYHQASCLASCLSMSLCPLAIPVNSIIIILVIFVILVNSITIGIT